MATMPTTVHELLGSYRRRELSPVEVVDDHLERIARLDAALNAFVVVDVDGARAAAASSAARWAAGDPIGDLDGVPVTVKDIVDMAGWPTSEGSAVASPDPADADSPPVARLREANAVILGKTTTPEFGWKGITDTRRFGITRNPWHLDRTPGGSSGGAGASLAAGIGMVAHGNDGGGSIRIPASYCGLIGLKPTFGRVPQAPVESPFVTLVANGPLARSVADAALLLNVLSRPDLRDWHAVPHDPRDWRNGIDDGLHGLRFAYSPGLGGAAPEAAVADTCRAAIDRLSDAGAHVVEVGPVIGPLRPDLERYWTAGFAERLHTIPRDRWDELDPGFRRLAEQGMSFDVHELARATAVRARAAETMRRFHLDHDILLTPTTPTPPPPVDVVYHSPGFDRWDHAVPYTAPFNYTGQPAASIPAGTVGDPPLPVGLQVVATHFREDLVLRACEAILDELGWTWTAADGPWTDGSRIPPRRSTSRS
jgi:aspartyl-tRNA(Asn)/glutamyl-tRNA(Gln) amidotransferase subunit A